MNARMESGTKDRMTETTDNYIALLMAKVSIMVIFLLIPAISYKSLPISLTQIFPELNTTFIYKKFIYQSDINTYRVSKITLFRLM